MKMLFLPFVFLVLFETAFAQRDEIAILSALQTGKIKVSVFFDA